MSDGLWDSSIREGRPGRDDFRLLGRLLSALLRLWGRTWRIDATSLDEEAARGLGPNGNLIYAFWHNRMVMLAFTHRHRNIQVLSSTSRDGQLMMAVLRRMGYGNVPGSSSRGGASGLRKMARLCRRGLDAAFTVDGPRGPRGSVKSGIITLAAIGQVPILPLAVSARPRRLLGSWDRTILPLPFSRLRLRQGQAIQIPRDADRGELEKYRLRLERELTDLTNEVDAEMGQRLIAAEDEGES